MKIEQIQQLLKDHGYYDGEIDGDVGPKTRKAANKICIENKHDLVNAGSGWNDNRRLVAAGQLCLNDQGFYRGTIDGFAGPLTAQAVTKWEIARQPSKPVPVPIHVPVEEDGVADFSKFDTQSAKRLRGAHPLLQRLLIAARAQFPFTVMDSQRNKEDQEAAFRRGTTKAHFGDSAHNWTPAVAVDLAPIPLDWSKVDSFIALWRLIGWYNPKTDSGAGLAYSMKIPLRWGGDWNMNGKYSDDGWDFPHYELFPWREWAKNSKPYTGD